MADPPRVLLIGDSIRLEYQPLVAARLGASVEVSGPPENCGDNGFDNETLGPHRLTGHATDRAGNTTTRTIGRANAAPPMRDSSPSPIQPPT